LCVFNAKYSERNVSGLYQLSLLLKVKGKVRTSKLSGQNQDNRDARRFVP